VLFHHGQSMLCAAKQLKGLQDSNATAIANEMVCTMPTRSLTTNRHLGMLADKRWLLPAQKVMKMVKNANIVGTLGVCP
jgi:hypothetical protein